MPDPALLLGSLCLLLVLAAVLVVVNAVRRSRRGAQGVEERGWTRLPDGEAVVAGWDGWPFLAAVREGGRATDVVTGQHQGVEFLSLRWSQHESGRGEAGSEVERYNIVALRCEHAYPHLSAVRGEHKVPRGSQHAGAEAFEVGDAGFDRRWQTLGDADFGRALLVPEVRAVMDDLDGAWVFQPGWVTRVVPWSWWAGEDRMLEELDRAAAPWRGVPTEAWQGYGGRPRFLDVLGGTTPRPGGDPRDDGPGRGWD